MVKYRSHVLDSSQITHGFFGRKGGVSMAVFQSLNCGRGSGDDPKAVEQNRALAAKALALNPDNLLSLHQIHSSSVITVTETWASPSPQADAMVTNVKGLGLGILTADCAPVLLLDEQAGVIGAAHAGWRGAFSGVLDNTISAMEKLGAARINIHAAIGPCIQQASYEVSEEFYQNFIHQNKDRARFFAPGNRPHHFQFDLSGYVENRLMENGLTHIDNCRIDTCAAENDYFSYRRMTLRGEPDYGRQISVIALRD